MPRPVRLRAQRDAGRQLHARLDSDWLEELAGTAMMRIFVPQDAAALALGADTVATAIAGEAAARGVEVTIIRNGSRGMFWLEPLVEIETPEGRTGFGPCSLARCTRLIRARGAPQGTGAGGRNSVPRTPAAPDICPLWASPTRWTWTITARMAVGPGWSAPKRSAPPESAPR